jgi:flagellar P-ring protein precursor FlgI
MRIQIAIFVFLGLCLGLCLALPALAEEGAGVRIKDIADVEGVRENMLVGYGLVVGLKGTGDSLTNSPFTEQSLKGMLERLGVNIRDQDVKTKNVAAVMVTATLPPFSQQGSRIDVTVSAMGDAKDLSGGTLLVTPLMGADGEVYAVGQGQLAVGGFEAGGAAATVSKGVPTSARIANGAIVEREINFDLASMDSIRFSLRNPDFTTAQRVAEVINDEIAPGTARATDPSGIVVATPPALRGDVVAFLTRLEQLRVEPDQVARVVIDEQSGVIVMGANVRISEVAVAQGNLTVKVTEMPQVSQPQPFSEGGETVVVPRTEVQVDEGSDRKLGIMAATPTLQELVSGLNALGVGPRDMITILQSIKAAGALQAELEVL